MADTSEVPEIADMIGKMIILLVLGIWLIGAILDIWQDGLTGFMSDTRLCLLGSSLYFFYKAFRHGRVKRSHSKIKWRLRYSPISSATISPRV